MIARTAAARVAGSVILAGALLTGTAGCTFVAEQATLIQYDPGDGVNANVGDVQVRNVVAIANEEGDAVSILMTFVNSGERSANVKVQFESGGQKLTVTKPVGANEVVSYGNTVDEDQIVVLEPGVEAGGLLPVYVQYGDVEGKQLLVPVLNADDPYTELGPAT